MDLSKIATISGKGGLFRIIGSTKGGAILESLDDARTKLVATTQHRLSVLQEISVYTTTKEGTVALRDVLQKIHADFKDDPGVDANDDGAELKAFLKSVLPEYDENRVYVSDIRKLVRWYRQLKQFSPAIFTDAAPAATEPQ